MTDLRLPYESTVKTRKLAEPFGRKRISLTDVSSWNAAFFFLTMTAAEAFLLPSAVVMVMTAVPGDFGVTVPSSSTVATSGALELHDTA